MRLGVDFDDVLYPYHHYLKRRLERRFGIDLTHRRVTTFYYENLPEFRARGISRSDVWEEVQATWREAASHDEAALLDVEAVPVLRELGARHRISVVSARTGDARAHVDRFLARHGLRPHEVLLGREQKHGFDVLVDDFPKHALENVESGGYSVLYTIDENSTFDESRHPRIRRVHSWREVRDVVEDIERRRPTVG